MAKIDALVADMYEVLQGKRGWDDYCLGDGIDKIAQERFSSIPEPRKYLSVSSVGSACKRQLWYRVNGGGIEGELGGDTLLKFFYGDVIEEIVLTLAEQAGHKVSHQQAEVDILGVKGHMDAVIDGMVVDVKSASPYSFNKFKYKKLRDDDPFGYISQLSSYVYACKDDPLVKDKTKGAFLVVNKVSGEILLDVHDFTKELEEKEKEVQAAIDMVAGTIPKQLPTEEFGKSGNEAVSFTCSFCPHKTLCYPDLRVFKSSRGPVYLTKVVREPRMEEIL